MPRKLKPTEIEKIDAQGTEITAYWDRNKKEFFVEVDGERIPAESLPELRKLAKEAMARAITHEWAQAITVSLNSGKPERFLVDLKPVETSQWGSRYPFVAWMHKDLSPDEKAKHIKTRWGCSEDFFGIRRRESRAVPYTDEMWESLTNLYEALNHFDALTRKALSIFTDPEHIDLAAKKLRKIFVP